MSYAIVFSSQTGNTQLLAETIRDALPREDCLYFGRPDPAALKADLIYAGFWTDKGGCDGTAADFLKQLEGKQVFLFGTAGFGGAPEYFGQILDRAKALLPESASVTGSYMCQGKMPMSVRERYVKMKNSPSPMPKADMLIENFDKALSHPDEADLEGLRKALAR